MEIKKKLLIEVIALSVTLSIVTTITIGNIVLIENNFSILNNELIPILTNLKDMRLIATNMLASTLEYATLTQNTSDGDTANQNLITISEDIAEEKLQFQQILDAYKARTTGSVNAALYNDIESQWKTLEQLSDKFLEYKRHGMTDDAFVKLNDDFIRTKESLFAKIDSAIISNQQNVDEKRAFVSAIVSNTTVMVIVNLAVFVLLVILLRYYIVRSMFRTVSYLRKITKQIASGDLNIKVESIPKDEVGDLLVDVEKMAHDLDSVQKKLLSAEKYSVIGELAARMAHDIRNPLMSIKIGAEYFRKKQDWTEKELNMFNMVDGAIDRISFQIQDVLDYIKVTPLALEQVSLLELLKRVSEIQKIPDGIELTLPQNDYTIQCDPRKIQVVFINMIRNAIDAAKPQGKIAIRLYDDTSTVKIEIEDSGPGIAPEHQPKIFDALFTTKMRGTGLGLSSVKNIIEQHKGTISFSNNPTIFTIILPKSHDMANLG